MKVNFRSWRWTIPTLAAIAWSGATVMAQQPFGGVKLAEPVADKPAEEKSAADAPAPLKPAGEPTVLAPEAKAAGGNPADAAEPTPASPAPPTTATVQTTAFFCRGLDLGISLHPTPTFVERARTTGRGIPRPLGRLPALNVRFSRRNGP